MPEMKTFTANGTTYTIRDANAVPKDGFTNWFTTGEVIPSGSDIDTYKTEGKYFCAKADTAGGYAGDCPVKNDNFVMFVFMRTNGGSLTQMIITMGGSIYIRGANYDGVWRAWNRVDVDEQTAAAVNALLGVSE